MRPIPRLASAACMALSLGGCANNPANVVFVTKASLGIDVEATAQSASFAYDRIEGYIAPRYADNDVPAAYASFATNGKLMARKIKQTYATGAAARLVSAQQPATPVTPAPATAKALYRNVAYDSGADAPVAAAPATTTIEPKAMFFGTGTVMGIKLGFGPTSIDSFTLGFKRKELSIIPSSDTDHSFPSVLASFDSDYTGTMKTDASLEIKQFFATGTAADALAAAPEIHRSFQENALSMLAEYRDSERQQSRSALLSLACLSELDDARLEKVWKNVKELTLFDDPAAIDALFAASAHDARMRYTKELRILNPKSQQQTGLRLGHQVYVCDLLKK